MYASQSDLHDKTPHIDLSYRSTFNDEPGPEDVPAGVRTYRLVLVWMAETQSLRKLDT